MKSFPLIERSFFNQVSEDSPKFSFECEPPEKGITSP
jgi:hypothetical protein